MKYYQHDYEKMKPIVINEQLGSEIDSDERAEYGLFTIIENFKAAIFYEISGGGYEVEIVTDDTKLIAVNRDSLAVETLKDYINHYEEIKSDKSAFEEKWDIVTYDTLGQPITQSEIDYLKSGGCCFIGGAVGGFIGSFPGITIMAATMFEPERYYGTWYQFISISAIVLGTALGAYFSNKIERNNTIKAIKEARKPRVIE